jgi:ABC-3C biological conflict system middle component
MILPGKHLRQDRAMLGVGAEILAELYEARTVSELWERVRLPRAPSDAPLSFDWFVLSLSFLYAVAAIDFADGLVSTRIER